MANLRRRFYLRLTLYGLGAGLALGAVMALTLLSLDLAVNLDPSTRRIARWLPFLLAVGPVILAARALGVPTDRRLTLLLDKAAGGAVASTLWTTQARASEVLGVVGSAFQERAERTLQGIRPSTLLPLAPSLGWLVGGATLTLLAGLVLSNTDGKVRWLTLENDAAFASAPPNGRPILGDELPPTLGTITWRVTPPSYTGLPVAEGTLVDALMALPGSWVTIRGDGSARDPIATVVTTSEESRLLAGQVDANGWEVAWPVTPGDRGLHIIVGTDSTRANGPQDERVIPLSVLEDAAPRLIMRRPTRDLVLATATGAVPIEVIAEDDYGVAELTLHWVRSRGSGELFDFDEGEWRWDDVITRGPNRTGLLTLELSPLALEPGDVLHVRAIARDGNTITGPGMGVSPTRRITISSEDDLSDVTTIIGFPIEREREPLLSQRMIILLTEELLEEASALNPDSVLEASTDIADEQARLRSRVGEEIFSRATGAMQDPEAHLEFEEGESEVFLDDLENRVEEGPLVDPETGIARIANVDIPAHDHDSDPIVAINRTLLSVYNFMWAAEQQLRTAQLRASLIPQNHALDELQAIRQSERVFARGRVTVEPIDVAGARGSGSVDDASPSPRSPTIADPSVTSAVEASLERIMASSAEASDLAALAVDLVRTGDHPEASRLLALAAADSVGRGERLTQILRLLRSAPPKPTPWAARAPSQAVSARYLADIGNNGEAQPADRTALTSLEPVTGPFVFATIRYQSGDWDSAPLVPNNLIHSLAQYTDLDVAPEGVVVDLSSPSIFDYPFLYLTGHLPVFFDEVESRNLVAFVERGGFVFIDDHNHDIDGAFHRSVQSELGRLFGPDALQAVPNDHELYTSFFEFEDGPPITGHELSGWGDGLIHRELYGIQRDGRLAVLYSNKDYSSEWSYHSQNKRFLAVDNTRFGVNLLIYVLTR